MDIQKEFLKMAGSNNDSKYFAVPNNLKDDIIKGFDIVNDNNNGTFSVLTYSGINYHVTFYNDVINSGIVYTTPDIILFNDFNIVCNKVKKLPHQLLLTYLLLNRTLIILN
jgi:hypothetical protein